MASALRLVAGLGNPGPDYARTRHNAGFWLVDALAARHGERFRALPRCFGAACEVGEGGRRLRLFKPDTFMNESGRAVAAVTRYFGVAPAELLVAHDDIDLPAGTVRLKLGGGHGGHNGLRDIVPALGDAGFVRLRIGVGHPGAKEAVVGHVLKRASSDDQRAIDEAIDRALDEMADIAAGCVARAMNVLNRKPGRDESADRDAK